MKPSITLCSTIFNGCMNNDTGKLSVACMWVIYGYVSMICHSKFVFWTNDYASARFL